MTDELPPSGRLAGIDYGTVRIGVAVSDPNRTLVSPYENYQRRSETKDADYFRHFVHQERVVGFVVGLPVHSSGDESQKSLEARAFGKWLNEVCDVPVVFYDERYTSAQAKTILSEAQLTKKQRKKRMDMLAAHIILSSYLEAGAARSEAPESLD